MDLSEKTELTWLADLIAELREAARAYESLVVDAMARDLLLHYGLGVPIARATADIDLAFAVPDWNAFNTLRNDLLASSYFTADRPSHRLVYRGYSPWDRENGIFFSGHRFKYECPKRTLSGPRHPADDRRLSAKSGHCHSPCNRQLPAPSRKS